MSVITAISDWLLAGVGGLATVTLGYARRVDQRSKTALETAERNDMLLTGDPDDPNNEGVLQIAFETRSEVREMRREMAAEHREVMDLISEDGGAGGDSDLLSDD